MSSIREDINGAVLLTEAVDSLGAYRVDVVVRELLGCDVDDLLVRVVLEDVVADRLKEMGLAESGAAPDEQRVVLQARRLRHGLRCISCEPIGFADHERIERVLRIEVDGGSGSLGRLPAEREPRPAVMREPKEPDGASSAGAADLSTTIRTRHVRTENLAQGSAQPLRVSLLQPGAREVVLDPDDEHAVVSQLERGRCAQTKS